MSNVEQDAEPFLQRAVQAFVGLSDGCPPAPSGGGWIPAAVAQGILAPVVAALTREGHPIDPLVQRYTTSRTARSLSVIADLRWLSDTLAAAGIPWVTVKGLVLSEVVYQRPGIRDYSDLDVLIRPADMRRALQVLCAGGARVSGVDWSTASWSRSAEIPLWLPMGTALDLHWSLVNRREVRRYYVERVAEAIERRQELSILGSSVPTLADVDFVAHVLVHACLDGCARWRLLLDAHQCVHWLAGRGHRPQDLWDRTDADRTAVAARAVLAKTARLLDPSIGHWVASEGASTAWTRLAAGIESRARPGALATPLSRKMYRHACSTGMESLAALGHRQALHAAQLIDPMRRRLVQRRELADWLDYVDAQAVG